MWTISKSLSTISTVRLLVAPVVGCSGVHGRRAAPPSARGLKSVAHDDIQVHREFPGPSLIEEARAWVEEALRFYLPTGEDPGALCPPRLAEAMRYSVLGGGKRLRPVLCLLAAEACGGELEAALPAACALELVHTYSLIHDDLPAMDDDDLRRGRPTCHKAFDEATAILAGDGLLTLAFEIVAQHVRPASAAVACVQALAEGSGPSGMVGGQMADLEAEGRR